MKKQVFEVIKSSHVTEKVSDLTSASNQYAFKVKKDSSKREIKKAVEETFSVTVEKVTVIKVKGKVKRSKYRSKKRPDWKKAYVRLSEGQAIETGIE